MSRKDKALQILQSYRKSDYRYLGEGAEGIVFTNVSLSNHYKTMILLILLQNCGKED